MSLLGKAIIICGKDGQGKSDFIEKNFVGQNFICLDWHGDYQKKDLPGVYFDALEANSMLEFCCSPKIKDVFICWEEAENYFGSGNANPMEMDKIKMNWLLSKKGPHHSNLGMIFVYHSPLQLPANIQAFYDYFILFDCEASDRDVRSRFNGSKIYDAYMLHKMMYNDPKEKIEKPNGEMIKPPLIFSRTKELPKIPEEA